MDYMQLALEEAKKAGGKGEVPVGAVIVLKGKVIAVAHNLKESSKCAVNHAEILAIKEASRIIDNWRLVGAEMYVTLEPCAMCAAAIAQSRISKLHIGTFNKDMGACGSVVNLLDYDIFNTYVEVNWCYNQECSDLLTDFFSKRRENQLKINLT